MIFPCSDWVEWEQATWHANYIHGSEGTIPRVTETGLGDAGKSKRERIVWVAPAHGGAECEGSAVDEDRRTLRRYPDGGIRWHNSLDPCCKTSLWKARIQSMIEWGVRKKEEARNLSSRVRGPNLLSPKSSVQETTLFCKEFET